MFSNYLAAALRHLARSRLYAVISIVGLAVGICALMLTLLVVRNELGYNRFVPGADRVFVGISVLQPKEQPAHYTPIVSQTLAAALKLEFPEIVSIARLMPDAATLRRGDVEAKETVNWVDPAFFDLMPLPTVAGDLRRA